MRVRDDLQIGHDVLHLAPVEETARADDAVRDLSLTKCLLQHARLVIRAEKHRKVLPRSLFGEVRGLHLLRNHVRLLLLILRDDDAHGLTLFIAAPQALRAAARVVFDQAVRRVQDRRRAAVVFLQLHDVRVREEVLKLRDVRDLRAAPAVDALVIVTHHADIVGRGHQRLQKPHLERIRVLELIHHHVVMPRLHLLAHVGVFFEQFDAEQQQIVEIHHVARAHLVLVALHHRRIGGLLRIAERAAVILRLADAGEHHARVDALFFRQQVFEDLFDQALLLRLAVDDEVFLVAEVLRELAQQPRAERVEGADHHLAAQSIAHHVLHARLHFARRLVREGHGEDVSRMNAFIHHERDARRDHARLARARAGEDEQRPVDVRRRLALLGIECARESAHDITLPATGRVTWHP